MKDKIKKPTERKGRILHFSDAEWEECKQVAEHERTNRSSLVRGLIAMRAASLRREGAI